MIRTRDLSIRGLRLYQWAMGAIQSKEYFFLLIWMGEKLSKGFSRISVYRIGLVWLKAIEYCNVSSPRPFDPTLDALPRSYWCQTFRAVFYLIKMNETKTSVGIFANLSVLNWTFIIGNNRVMIVLTAKKKNWGNLSNRFEFATAYINFSVIALWKFLLLLLIKQRTILMNF